MNGFDAATAVLPAVLLPGWPALCRLAATGRGRPVDEWAAVLRAQLRRLGVVVPRAAGFGHLSQALWAVTAAAARRRALQARARVSVVVRDCGGGAWRRLPEALGHPKAAGRGHLPAGRRERSGPSAALDAPRRPRRRRGRPPTARARVRSPLRLGRPAMIRSRVRRAELRLLRAFVCLRPFGPERSTQRI